MAAQQQLMSIEQAARALGIGQSTLRRWVTRGAPMVRRGRRGRGGQALLDPSAISSWRASGAAPRAEVPDAALDFRAELISLRDLVMATIVERFSEVEGPAKRQIAAEFAALGYAVTYALEDAYDLPVVEHASLERLRQLADL